MTIPAVLADNIRGVIAATLGVHISDVTDDKRLVDDLGADSLDVIEVVMKLEDTFDVVIEDDLGMSIVTVGDAIRVVEQLKASAAEQVAL